MSLFRNKRRRALAIAIVVVLALFMVRPGAQWMRSRIVNSISLAMGRQVSADRVSLRFLPQPGFEMENFTVQDDPQFSSEPMLSSSDVAASLRLTSLLRGRIEISRLDLTAPSLNLVRNTQGHWNLEELVQKAATTPVAPTSKSRSERRPGFPYIEASDGRINFKFGQEKKAYALTDADYSFWQASENTWGMRLRASPVRTDFNLTDTGTLRVNGTWQRAPNLRQTPLQFSLQWDGGQLGQLTKLASGDDKGWRGGLTLSATLTGRPADLAIETSASVDDFRRYNVVGGDPLRLAAQCGAHYSSVDHVFSQIACDAPTGGGDLSLTGTLGGPSGLRNYDLKVVAQSLSLQSLLTLARHIRNGLPKDLVATGTLNARAQLQRSEEKSMVLTGSGDTAGFRLHSDLTDAALSLDRVPFSFSSGAPRPPHHSRYRAARHPDEPQLEIGPFPVSLERSTPVLVSGWIARSGYGFALDGDAQVRRALQVAALVGLPVPRPAADGPAKLDLQIANSLPGLTAPQITGKIQLHSVHAELRGVAAPLEITSANLALAADQANVAALVATLGDSTWHGSLTIPRPCATACSIGFDLHTDALSTNQLGELFSQHSKSRPWYRFLTFAGQAGPPYLATIRAHGKFAANRLTLGALATTHVSANADLDKGVLRLSQVRADVLGGRHSGEWEANFAANPPTYKGSGSIEHAALRQVAVAMSDGWVTGSADAHYSLKLSGHNAKEMLASATGKFEVDARDGSLPHITLTTASGPLQMRHLNAEFALQNGTLEMEKGSLETTGGIYQVSGTASLRQTMNFKLMRDPTHIFGVTGTLAQPRVIPLRSQQTEAALKP